MTIEVRIRVPREGFDLDVDITIPDSGVTALFGPSGCGKTTLLRAIAGLEQSAKGVLRVGESVWQNDTFHLPAHQRPVGFVFQEASLFEHLSVRGNLEYGLRRIRTSDIRISLENAISLLGIGHLLSRKPDNLSGGERQRVAIARALAVSPELLLMDEPLSALDLGLKREIMPYLESMTRELDIPIIYVSHEPGEVSRLANHIVLMEKGAVLGSGATAEMFTRLDFPFALSERASSLIEAKVCSYDESYGLTVFESSGVHLTASCKPVPIGQSVKLRVFARDISIVLEEPFGTSILNVLPVVIDDVIPLSDSQMMLRLVMGNTLLLARVTRKSVADLGLIQGKNVYAQIKSVALLI